MYKFEEIFSTNPSPPLSYHLPIFRTSFKSTQMWINGGLKYSSNTWPFLCFCCEVTFILSNLSLYLREIWIWEHFSLKFPPNMGKMKYTTGESFPNWKKKISQFFPTVVPVVNDPTWWVSPAATLICLGISKSMFSWLCISYLYVWSFFAAVLAS